MEYGGFSLSSVRCINARARWALVQAIPLSSLAPVGPLLSQPLENLLLSAPSCGPTVEPQQQAVTRLRFIHFGGAITV